MGAHRKRHGRPHGVGLLERARRELAKGNAKQALKDAKVLHRSEASSESRQLLEEAYLGRVEQLRAVRQLEDARTVLDELIALVPTTAAVCQQIPRLQALVGAGGEQSARLLETDAALLRNLRTKRCSTRVLRIPTWGTCRLRSRRYGRRLQQWSAATMNRRHSFWRRSRAARRCRTGSFLCAVSRLFINDDDALVEQNWRRLDRTRPAWRIAQTLLAAVDPKRAEDAQFDVMLGVRRLARSLQTDPASEWVRRLSEHWQQSAWREFFREFRSGRQRFAKTHTKLIESIVDLVWKRAVRDGEYHMLHEVMRIGPAPPLDPHWDRARAMMAEHHGDYEVSPVVDNWNAYAEKLARLECLQEHERPIAAGLVHLHVARQYARYAEDNEGLSTLHPLRSGDDTVSRFRQAAARSYRKAIECSSQLTAAYHELAELHAEMDGPAKGAAVLQRLVREKPDEYDAHIWLAHYYLGRDEPGMSESHVQAAVRLKPRDGKTGVLRWNQRLTAIRCLVRKRKLEAARQETLEAEKHVSADTEPYLLDMIRASIEFKAKNESAAQQHLDTALSKVEEPTAIYAHMSCLAAQFWITPRSKERIRQSLQGGDPARADECNLRRLARFLLMLRGNQINFTGRATLERLFLKSLKRSRRVTWQEADLEAVCTFLSRYPREVALRERLLKAAVKRFTDSAQLHLLAGELEMESGPFACNYKQARHHMERAVELISMPGRQKDESIVERAGARRRYWDKAGWDSLQSACLTTMKMSGSKRTTTRRVPLAKQNGATPGSTRATTEFQAPESRPARNMPWKPCIDSCRRN